MQRKKQRKPDRITHPTAYSSAEAGSIYGALKPLDKVADDMETKWGVDRLIGLVSVDTAAKFGSATEKLNAAIEDQNVDLVKKKAEVMIKGWHALDREAAGSGHKPISVETWVGCDNDGKQYTIVKDLAAAREYAKIHNAAVYTADEVARIITAWQSRDGIVQNVKDTFPGAEVKTITPMEELLNDEVPF